jgi:hypothetical protein
MLQENKIIINIHDSTSIYIDHHQLIDLDRQQTLCVAF